MRKYFCVVLLFITFESTAQKTFTLRDLFKQDTVVWFGIDYTRSKFVGTFDNKDLRNYFVGWNRLITEEPYKYDLRMAMRKRSIKYDMASVEEMNAEAVPEINVIGLSSTMQSGDLSEMIAKYKSVRAEGIGVVLIADQYNRLKGVATHFLVIFDIASRKILISQKYATRPDGIGIRNFWARTIYGSVKLLGKSYGRWLKKYGTD